MDYVKYLNHLLDIMIGYKKYRNRIFFFFSECIGGDVSPIIKDLNNLVEKPIEKYDKRDWQGITYILSLKRRNNNGKK